MLLAKESYWLFKSLGLKCSDITQVNLKMGNVSKVLT